jgi:hypothetical protein
VPAPAPAGARIAFGQVRHERRSPVSHRFDYPTAFLLLPLRTLARRPEPALARNRAAAFSFRDADHGDGGGDALAWFDALLAREGVHDADGEVWLHCFPRMLGVAFKPVSFWYAHRADGSIAAILAEVHNTFGERHGYLLHGPDGASFGPEYVARKVFHVSPFCPTQGEYRFRFLRTDVAAADGRGRTTVRIEWHEQAGPSSPTTTTAARPASGATLVTSISGEIEPLTARSVRRALWRSPWMTAAIVARIHWQALRLWAKRVAIHSLPPAPAVPVTHGGPAISPSDRLLDPA